MSTHSRCFQCRANSAPLCVPPAPPLQCLEFAEGSVTGDMCDDLCVLGLVEYKRCLYYENGKKVIEARWRGNRVILKSKLENFSSYEPLGILDYQVSRLFASCLLNSLNFPSLVENSPCRRFTPTGHGGGALPSRRRFLRHSGSKSRRETLLAKTMHTFVDITRCLCPGPGAELSGIG